jgi:hypothetical protein
MTLAAAILIFGISSLTLVDARLLVQSTPQAESSASPPTTQQQPPPVQTDPEAIKPSSAQPPSTQATGKPKTSTAKKTHPKNKVVPAAACDPPPANSAPPGSDPATASPHPGGPEASSTPEATKPCPPPKIVVKQGGVAEQSIQLAGGSAGGEATQKRNAANQMLAATDENLKKISGRRLSIAEQGSVIQIRQFVDQSKTALTAGNLERAQTLAWKAKLLSEDLIKPQQ